MHSECSTEKRPTSSIDPPRASCSCCAPNPAGRWYLPAAVQRPRTPPAHGSVGKRTVERFYVRDFLTAGQPGARRECRQPKSSIRCAWEKSWEDILFDKLYKECFCVILWTSTGRAKHSWFSAAQVGQPGTSEGLTERRHRRPSPG